MTRSFSLSELPLVATELINALPIGVVLFNAPMGAGKTTLVSALLKSLGVTEPGSSPTFSIIQEYQTGRDTIMHMDLYRLKDEEEALQAGVQDAMDKATRSFIEWPLIAPGLFNPETPVIELELTEGDKRKLTLTTLADVQAKLPEQS